MQVMSETLATGKGVSMKGFISITSVRTSNRDPRSGLKHHVFLMAHNFCRSYGLTYRKPGMCLLAPCIEVNTSKLVVMTGYSKHDIQSTLKALVTKIGEVCGGGDHLKIPFERLGILLCEKRHVSFKLERIKAVGMMHKSEVGAGENVSEITSWVDKFIKSKEEEKAEARRVEERKLREETQRLIDKEMAAMAAMRKLDAPDSNTICSKDLEQQSNNNPTPRAVSRNHTPVPIRNKELQRIEELMMSKRFQDTDYVTEKNKLEHAMVNSVFPKFLIPDQVGENGEAKQNKIHRSNSLVVLFCFVLLVCFCLVLEPVCSHRIVPREKEYGTQLQATEGGTPPNQEIPGGAKRGHQEGWG